MSRPIDVPEADRAEQEQPILDEAAGIGLPAGIPDDVDAADAVDQQVAVPLDEDDAPR